MLTMNRTTQRGLSLVELMVAVTLGLLVTAAVLGLYAATNRNYREAERFALMQENGRYALKVLSEALTMVNFWGQMTSPDTITTGLAASGNCIANLDLFDASTALISNNDHASPANTQFTPCAEITGVQKADTDLLVTKRVEGAPAARTFTDVTDTDGDGDTTEVITEGQGTNSVVYLRTNGFTGTFIDNSAAGNLPALGESDWRYLPHIYFVRDHYETPDDGIPALCRMGLVGTGMGSVTDPPNGVVDQPQCLAEGIEDFHVQFGIDIDDDGFVDRYVTEPTLADMERAVTARVYVLARSSQPIANYQNTKTYSLGGTIPSGGPTYNDGFYRRVYSTTVLLRNSVSLHLLGQ
jgi:type IV pilus assembly protein PilW